jgi:hypothetical protein
MQPLDNIIVNSFVKKFNEKYNNNLLEDQKTLLNHYITSFTDNGLGLKTFLNNEISRLKTTLEESLTTEIIQEDEELTLKTNQVIEKLTNFHKTGITEDVVLTVLRTQQLVEEIHTDGN